MFLGDAWASLSAKAADSRQLVFALLPLCLRLNDASDRDGHRILALHHLVGVYHVFDSAGMFLTTEEFEEACAHRDAFFEHYAWLMQAAVNKGFEFYPIRTKTLFFITSFNFQSS